MKTFKIGKVALNEVERIDFHNIFHSINFYLVGRKEYLFSTNFHERINIGATINGVKSRANPL